MKIIFLGTNGWYNTYIGNTVSTLLITDKYYIIFDAGDGLYKLDRFIKDDKPIHLFISHPHLDHITGLHTLDKFYFPQGIDIYVPKGMKALLENIICSPYSVDFKRVRFPVRYIQLSEGAHDIGYSLEARSLTHSVATFGYRIEADGKCIAYCCDTGLCDNLTRLAKDADLFITECSLRTGEDDKSWPHLNPHMAASAAVKAKAKKLILTHFNAFLFPDLKDRAQAEKDARDIFPDSFSAKDEMEILC